MRAERGGSTKEEGRYAITITPTTQHEARQLAELAVAAVKRMSDYPNLIQPKNGAYIILSYRKPANPQTVLRELKHALNQAAGEQ